MSAFVLIKGNDNALLEQSRKTFQRRGFKGERLFNTSIGTLLLYPKQNLNEDNFYKVDSCSVYCIGTIVYKGLSYADSLKAMASDYVAESLEINELRGSFVALFDKDSHVSLLTDSTHMYRLYTDEERRFLSSSLMVAASLTECHINEDAVVEQLLCGYVGGDATLIQNITDVSFELNKIPWIKKIPQQSKATIAEKGDEANRVKVNAKILHDYLQDVKALSSEFGAECGLSGGCDSRLIFSSVNVDCVPMNSVHTHQTSQIHDKEIEVVKQLSHLYHVPLRIVSTTYLPDYEGDIDDVLRENVLYFDARNAGNIGAMSQTHTRKYKRQTSDGAAVTFSGIGGEIYRNFYFTNLPLFSFPGWIESRLFESGSQLLFPRKTYKEAKKRIARKIAIRTGQHIGNTAFLNMSKRYFDSYRIPYALGNVVNANNQMSFYLAPFTEKCLIEEAKKDWALQDHCGAFEGRILKQFDPQAASIETSRGYTLSNIPQSVLLKWKLRGLLPACVWRSYEKRNRYDLKRKESYAALKLKSSYFREALACFQKMFPNWFFQAVDEGCIPLNNFVFTVCAVYELTHSTTK